MCFYKILFLFYTQRDVIHIIKIILQGFQHENIMAEISRAIILRMDKLN